MSRRRRCRRSVALFASVALTCAAAATPTVVAQAPPPGAAPAAPAATSPTTQGANIPTDQSTPKSALRVLADAMESGDQKGILGVFLARSPQEERMAGAMADLAVALAGLRKEAVAAFGAEGA